MQNKSSVPHDIAIKGDGVSAGRQDRLQRRHLDGQHLSLKPGTYTFYCSVDGHEAAGMKGTLTVK